MSDAWIVYGIIGFAVSLYGFYLVYKEKKSLREQLRRRWSTILDSTQASLRRVFPA
jgi:hypothetical protein